MSVNTNVQIVKEKYLAGYEDEFREVTTTTQHIMNGFFYEFTKTYSLSNDITAKVNDLMKNKKSEYYLWRYYDFFQTILKIDNLSKDLEYEHVCFCFERLPHIESILINNIWRLREKWSHTIICCQDNFNFISAFVKKTNANIRIIKLNLNHVFIHEINDYLLNKEFLNKFHGRYLLFTNVSSLITSNILPSDFNKDVHYVNTFLEENECIDNFSFYDKEIIINQLGKLKHKNEEYKHSPEYFKYKKDYYLEKIPSKLFYNSVLESEHVDDKYLKKKIVCINNFSHLPEDNNKEEIFTKVLKYLEELLNIYY